jgi:hypothetical protein
LPTRLPEKIQKQRWLKPKKTHDKASKRSMTGAEAAEQAADRAEKAAARPTVHNEDESDGEEGILVPGTPPGPQGAASLAAGESQGGTIITLSLRTPERLRGPPGLIPTITLSPEASPEAQVQLPASTAPARMDEGARKRRRVANKLYRDSQYEL